MPPFVLIVEDDVDLRLEMGEFLGKRGCRIAACGSMAAAREAIEKSHLDRVPPQYVITDINLPDGDGLALFIEFAPKLVTTRWILMSGSHDLERLSAELRSFQEHDRPSIVEKPFPLSVLQQLTRESRPNTGHEGS